MPDEDSQRRRERRKGDRRTRQVPFEGPDRRSGRDRRRFVRQVMSGEVPLPAVDPRDPDPRRAHEA